MTVRPGADHRPRVLYYAHQHGAGHVHHARTLIATGAFDVTVVTAHPRAVAMLPDGADVVPLPSDLVDGHLQPAGSPLHWTPVGPQIQQRFGTLLAASQRVEPDVVVVDVSVEAALFLRLAGYPVIHRRMHGDRIDAAHELVYAQADALVAYYCAGLENPAWLQRFGDKAVHLGTPDVTGRLGEQARTVRGLDAGGAPRIVVVTGTGGGGVQRADLVRAAQQVPRAQWDVYGPVVDPEAAELPKNLTLRGWTEDVPARLAEADLVVVSAGHNASVDAVRSGRPLVLAPEERPFDEQLRFAQAAQAQAGVPWCAWADPDADWAGAVRAALADPASADRLAAQLLTEPAEHRRRWEQLVDQVAQPR